MGVRDPYEVLGVAPNASDDEIKTAYRDMAKKYHPDNYSNNPLSDLAQEKMQEINEAYDSIVRMRQSGVNGSSGQPYYDGPHSHGGNSRYFDIRNMIRSGRVLDAETLLDGIPMSSRDAEWHFLKGSVLYRKGWLDEAYSHFSAAVNMDPANMEYRQALEQFRRQRQTGGYRTAGQPAAGCGPCEICMGLMCADSCCRCMC